MLKFILDIHFHNITKITKTDQYHVENYKKFKKNFFYKKKLEKLKEAQILIKIYFTIIEKIRI